MKTGQVPEIIMMAMLLALLLSGCHGSNDSTPSGGSDWGQMTWDQDTWS